MLYVQPVDLYKKYCHKLSGGKRCPYKFTTVYLRNTTYVSHIMNRIKDESISGRDTQLSVSQRNQIGIDGYRLSLYCYIALLKIEQIQKAYVLHRLLINQIFGGQCCCCVCCYISNKPFTFNLLI